MFTTGKAELDLFNKKHSTRIVSRVAERLNTYDCKNLGNIKERSKLGLDRA